MKNIKSAGVFVPRIVLAALFLGLASTSHAQLTPPPNDLVPIAVADVPDTVCNYYSLQPWRPPLPFNWLADETNILLYVSPSIGTNAIWVGDVDIDYAQRAAENEVLTLAAQAASGRLSMQTLTYQPNDYTYTMDDLYLELLVLTNSSASIIVHTWETDGVYDLYFAIDLRSTNSLNSSSADTVDTSACARSVPSNNVPVTGDPEWTSRANQPGGF